MKILVDMNLSPDWVTFLDEAGFEAVHWSHVGLHSAPDADVMDWATKNEQVVLTADLDFGAILAASKGRRPSVILLRSDIPTPSATGSIVVLALRESASELAEGALISLDARHARLRILPMNDEA